MQNATLDTAEIEIERLRAWISQIMIRAMEGQRNEDYSRFGDIISHAGVALDQHNAACQFPRRRGKIQEIGTWPD